MRWSLALACAAALACSCGAPGAVRSTGNVSITGIVEVYNPGAGEQTIVLVDDLTGSSFVLTGEVAAELRESWGSHVTVLGAPLPPEQAGGGRPRLEVLDYTCEGGNEESSPDL